MICQYYLSNVCMWDINIAKNILKGSLNFLPPKDKEKKYGLSAVCLLFPNVHKIMQM